VGGERGALGQRGVKLAGVLLLDGFPRNAAGKTLRREIKRMYLDGEVGG